MKIPCIILISMLLLLNPLMANTTRELPPPPDYNPDMIKKHVILFFNIERINNGKPALVMNKKLNAAAQWHSGYMAETEQMLHVADKKGMHDVTERVSSVTDRIGLCAEIIAFSYSLSANGIPFTAKKDKDGEYIDFGNVNVYWLNETGIAMLMIKDILNDHVYKEYLSNDQINSIGGGVTAGKSRGLEGWYASFAIVQKTDLARVICKSRITRDVIKKQVNGKETDETVIKYDISGFNGEQVAILAINSGGVYRVFGSRKVSREYSFRIDDEFRKGIADDEKIYIATYDKENDTYYPVMRIDTLK